VLNEHARSGPLYAKDVSLGPPESSTQTVSRSLQPFWKGSPGYRPTDRPTDHATWSVTIDGAHSGEAKFCYCLRLQQVFIGAVDSTDRINSIQYSPRIGPLYATGVCLGTPVSRSLPNFLQGLLGDRSTKRPTNHATRSFTIGDIGLRIKGKERKGKDEYLYSAICILCISQSAQS